MKIRFDVEKLKGILTDFYNFTNVAVSIFDAEFNNVASCPGYMAPYCARIREDEGRHANCIASDKNACMISCERRESYSYVCHAGINETVTPIFYENIIVGYILFGQYRKEGESIDTARQSCYSYGLDFEEMKERYLALKTLTESQVSSAVNILKICIAKIWLDELIKVEKNMLAASIQVYIGNSLSSPLTARHLCKRFLLNKKQLYKLFRENFNMSVKDYIISKRLELAVHLLKTTNKPLDEICMETGFSDYNNFIQRFKAKMGITPHKFRILSRQSSRP